MPHTSSGDADEQQLEVQLTGGATVSEVGTAFQRLLSVAARSGILWLILAIQAVSVTVGMGTDLLIEEFSPNDWTTISIGIVATLYLVLMIVTAFGMSVYQPLRIVYFRGSSRFDSFGTVLDAAISKFPSAFGFIIGYAVVLVCLALTGGIMGGLLAGPIDATYLKLIVFGVFMLPTLVAATGLVPGFYLSVCTDNLGIGDCLQQSWNLFTRRWAPILTAGLLYLATGTAALLALGFGLHLTGRILPVSLQMAASFIIGLTGFVFFAALMVRVEAADRSEHPEHLVWRRAHL